MITVDEAVPEMVRKAFKQARTERPGADVPDAARGRRRAGDRRATPLRVNVPVDPAPSDGQVQRAAEVLESATAPVVLAGPGVARDGAMDALVRFSERLQPARRHHVPRQGRLPRRPPERARDDRLHGARLRELRLRQGRRRRGRGLRPRRVRAGALEPRRGTRRSSTSTGRVAEVDEAYTLEVGVQGGIGESLGRDRRGSAGEPPTGTGSHRWSASLREELGIGRRGRRVPRCRPQRIVARRPRGARVGTTSCSATPAR